MAEEHKPPAGPVPKGAAVPTNVVVVGEYPPRHEITRRGFLLSWAGAAWGTFALANAVGGAALLRFMLPNVLFEPPQKFKAGKLDDYEWDKPDERYKTA